MQETQIGDTGTLNLRHTSLELETRRNLELETRESQTGDTEASSWEHIETPHWGHRNEEQDCSKPHTGLKPNTQHLVALRHSTILKPPPQTSPYATRLPSVRTRTTVRKPSSSHCLLPPRRENLSCNGRYFVSSRTVTKQLLTTVQETSVNLRVSYLKNQGLESS